MGIAFFSRKELPIKYPAISWSNQDLADFYRALDILRKAGLDLDVDSGLSDEGDPWFVFLRPLSGDVVAHFAQIDGCFIAVSSFNHEVYKGQNIRTIVDKMLQVYPKVLTSDNQNAKLFLHPTAAISAFLAAAIILNLDDIKEGTITEIFNTAKSSIDGTLSSDGVIARLAERIESNKSNISELNVVNSNVAALGAALIAHDLSQPATKTYNWSKLDVNQLAWEKENVVAEDSEAVEVLVNADIPKEIEAYKNSEQMYAQLEAGVFGENENKNSFEEKSADMGLIENVSVNFLQSEATIMPT